MDRTLESLAISRSPAGRNLKGADDVIAHYRESVGPDRRALLDEGKVRVTIATFDGVEVDSVMNELLYVEGLELENGVQAGSRAFVDAVVPLDGINGLAALPFVQFVEDAPTGVLRNGTTGPVIQSGATDQTPVWDRGIHGEGQIVGLIDAMPKLTHCMFEDTVPVGPGHRKFVAVRPTSPPAAHSHGTHVAGTLAGDYGVYGLHDTNDGIAFAARISYSSYFDVSATPSTLLPRLRDAHDDGARVHSNSWGDDTKTSYTVWCSLADQFSHENEEDLVVFAATNQSTLRSPENAKNVLAVGASRQYPNHNAHCQGGRGPTFDGRRKPEIYAPGCNIRSASISGTCNFVDSSGTSYAAPAISAAATLVRQYFVEGFYPTGTRDPEQSMTPSGALMKAAILNASLDMTGIAGYPSDQEGWGRLELDRALYFWGETRRLVMRDVRNGEGLATGQTRDFPITVLADDHDLRVTLVFTDPPAAIGSSNPVVNDLDLLVTGPDTGISGGAVYRGNYFKQGRSAALGTPDPLNNVEQVYLPAPAAGVYSIEVAGTAVNGLDPQGYAVVVSGNVIEGAYNPPPEYADPDGDGDLDLADFAGFQVCYTGESGPPADPACAQFDADGDQDVDIADFQAFRQLFTGPE
jgi:hypothetical protein